jgi:hypothetical protein
MAQSRSRSMALVMARAGLPARLKRDSFPEGRDTCE